MLLPPNSIAFTWSPLLSTEMGERATFFALRPKLTIRITYPPPNGDKRWASSREGLGRILSKEGGEGSFTEGWGGLFGDESECFSIYLTSIHIFPAIIRKK